MVTNTDFNTIGGAQESQRNLLQFDGNWAIISPYNLPEGLTDNHLTTATHKIPFCGHCIPTRKGIDSVKNFLNHEQPFPIIINHPDLYSSTLFLSLPKEMRCKTIAIWRGIADLSPSIIEEGKPKELARKGVWAVLRRMQKIVGNNVRKNLAVSQAVAQSLTRIGIDPQTISVIPEQVGGEYTPELRIKHGNYFREKFLPHNTLGVLVVSRISPEKGLCWIPRLYSYLRQGRKNIPPNAFYRRIKITLVGGAIARKRGYLHNLLHGIEEVEKSTACHHASGSVSFEYVGPKDHQELQGFYNSHDVLLMPSPAEGFGRVTAEALSSGMTVIGRKSCAATTEILSEPPYSIGILVESPEEAGTEILRLTSEIPFLQLLQSQAMQWGTNHFSLARAEEEFWNAIGY